MDGVHKIIDGLPGLFVAMLKGHLHTAEVGQITEVKGCEAPPGTLPGAVYEASPTADIQLVTMTQFLGEDEAKPKPPLLDVPLIFPGGGDWWMTHKPVKGEYVLCIFSELCLDQWKASGGVSDPLSGRSFDRSDAVAIFGLRSNPNKVPMVDGGIVLGKLDGSSNIMVTESAIVAESSGIRMELGAGGVTAKPVNPAGLADVAANMPAGAVSLLTHTHSGVTTGPGSSGPPVPVPIP
jgi:hypothetical protein